MTHAGPTGWTVEDSRRRRCKRWSLYPEHFLDLTVAEMDVGVADPIMVAIRDAVDRQAFGYPLPDHATELPAVAADWLSEQGHPVHADHIRLMPDVIKGMVLGVRHFTAPATPVVVITPTYSRFLDAVEAAERPAIEVPMLHRSDGYTLDLDGIEAAMRTGARTVLLCSPSNPVGRVFDRAELSDLGALVERYGARVISDEIHAPIRYGVDFVPYASISTAAAEHSITLTSASKAWNIPGLRCALVVLTNPADWPIWDALPRASKGGISPLGIEASIAAFTDGGTWLKEVTSMLDSNRRLVVESFSAAGLDEAIHLPEATYLAWLDLRRFGLDDPRRYLLEKAAVATTSGEEHGAAGAGFVRLNFASPEDVLVEAMERIDRALRGRTVRAPA